MDAQKRRRGPLSPQDLEAHRHGSVLLSVVQEQTLRYIIDNPHATIRDLCGEFRITMHAVWCRLKALRRKGWLKAGAMTSGFELADRFPAPLALSANFCPFCHGDIAFKGSFQYQCSRCDRQFSVGDGDAA
jgi:hypothetical protein